MYQTPRSFFLGLFFFNKIIIVVISVELKKVVGLTKGERGSEVSHDPPFFG